jgi:hypothetical protein
VTDCDDPEINARWCAECRAEVAGYLQREGLMHGEIGRSPAWHVAPYVSVWAVESRATPSSIGWWAIAGDLPNDYVSAANIGNPREAVRAIASLWRAAAESMFQRLAHPTFRIGTGEREQELAPLLASRAELLLEWASDEDVWEDER